VKHGGLRVYREFHLDTPVSAVYLVPMESVITNREMLPQTIFSYIHSEKIRLFEENGNVILSPVKEPDVRELFGMFNDGRLSSDDFLRRRAIEERDI
jgi:hypothetical protein